MCRDDAATFVLQLYHGVLRVLSFPSCPSQVHSHALYASIQLFEQRNLELPGLKNIYFQYVTGENIYFVFFSKGGIEDSFKSLSEVLLCYVSRLLLSNKTRLDLLLTGSITKCFLEYNLTSEQRTLLSY